MALLFEYLHLVVFFLQKSPSRSQAIKALILIQRLLVFHPPSENTSLYQCTLGLHASADGTSVEGSGSEWEFLKTLCR